MNHSGMYGGLIALFFLFSVWYSTSSMYGQSQPSMANPLGTSTKNVVSINSSITVDVENNSYKDRSGILTSAVNSFLNSGPNIFKTPVGTKSSVFTKILNQINKDTQTLQGVEATNAIVGVEINKALKSRVSSLNKLNQTEIITISASSRCTPLTVGSNCSNTIIIK